MTVEVPRPTLKDVLVIDTDVHAHESPEQLAPYVDSEWRLAFENLRVLQRRYLDLPGFCPNNAPDLLGATLPAPRGARIETVLSAQQMRKELDELFVDIGIIFPDHLLKLAAIPHAAYAGALARAYHRWVREQWLDADNDLYGVIVAIPQDAEEAVREIERWADDKRFVGIYLPTCQSYPLWGQRK